jgi:hypothetical protein
MNSRFILPQKISRRRPHKFALGFALRGLPSRSASNAGAVAPEARPCYRGNSSADVLCATQTRSCSSSLRRLIPTHVPHPPSLGVGSSLTLARNPMNTPSNPHQKRLIVDATEWTARLERLAGISRYSLGQPTSANQGDRADHDESVNASLKANRSDSSTTQ